MVFTLILILAAVFGIGFFLVWWFYLKDGCDDEIPSKNYSLCATGDLAEEVFVEECGDAWMIKEYGPCGCGLMPKKNLEAFENTLNQPDQDTRYIKCLENAPIFADHSKCRCSCDNCYKDYCENETTIAYWNNQCFLLFGIID